MNEMNALITEARRIVQNLSKGMAFVYFLRLKSGIVYVGATVDLEQRLHDHSLGHACRTTHLDPASALLRLEPCTTFTEARRRERQLKRWSRAKKEALIRGDGDALKTLSRSRTSRTARAHAFAQTQPVTT